MDESTPMRCHCHQKTSVHFETKEGKPSLPLENQKRTKKPTPDRRKSAPLLRTCETTEETKEPDLQSYPSPNVIPTQKTFAGPASGNQVEQPVVLQAPQLEEKGQEIHQVIDDNTEKYIQEGTLGSPKGTEKQHLMLTGEPVSGEVVKVRVLFYSLIYCSFLVSA